MSGAVWIVGALWLSALAIGYLAHLSAASSVQLAREGNEEGASLATAFTLICWGLSSLLWVAGGLIA